MTTGPGKVRRFALTLLGGGPVPGRVGACDHCGLCCEGCSFHDGRGCSIYAARPLQCRAFPLDAADVREVGRCAYAFLPGSPTAGEMVRHQLFGDGGAL
jgi:hypothetical protein